MQTTTTTATQSKTASETPVHNRSNSWYDGEKWIPITEMSNEHLRRAKLYAQKKQEYHWHKEGEFSDMVEMLEAEGKKRDIKMRDYRSKFTRNDRRCKKINESI